MHRRRAIRSQYARAKGIPTMTDAPVPQQTRSTSRSRTAGAARRHVANARNVVNKGVWKVIRDARHPITTGNTFLFSAVLR